MNKKTTTSSKQQPSSGKARFAKNAKPTQSLPKTATIPAKPKTLITKPPKKTTTSTPSQGTPQAPIFLGGKDAKPVPEKTKRVRKARSDFYAQKQQRELRGYLGSNDNANTGGGLESAGYSPYVLS